MSNLFSADFTGAADAITLETLSDFVKQTGYTTSIYIYGEVVRPSNGAGAGTKYGYRIPTIVGLPDDYSMAVDYIFKTTVGTAPYGFYGVTARASVSAETFYYGGWESSTNTWIFGKRINGTATNFAVSGTVSATYVGGDTIRPRIVPVGNQISLYNGETLIYGPVTDTSITSGQPGFRYFQGVTASDTTGVHVDNISVDTLDAGSPTTDVTIAANTGNAVFSGTSYPQPKTIIAALLGNAVFSGTTDAGSVTQSSIAALLGNAVFSGTSYPQPTTIIAATLASATFSGVTSVAGTGTITSLVMRDLTTKSIRANETGITVFVNDETTGELVVKLTGQTSNSSGINVISDVSIIPGTIYSVRKKFADGSQGTSTYTAA